MRREDRQITEGEAWEIMKSGEYGILSVVRPEGGAYGVPVNYCLMDKKVTFHMAREGYKTEAMAAEPRVCFTVVGNTEVQEDKFSTLYESAVLMGRAREVYDEEKLEGLKGLIRKYSPEHLEEGFAYAEKSSVHTRVFVIEPESVTGKARKG